MTPRKKSSIVMLPALLGILLAVGCLLYGLPASLAGPKVVNHLFDFGLFDENKDVEILDWRYGSSKLDFTVPPAYQLATGHINQATSVGGFFPVGDSLYVKWRVESTGKVYEDTVDLKTRLPLNITNKTIHFTIRGSQLYVYLIEGDDHVPTAGVPDYAIIHADGAPDCPIPLYRTFKCTELYPEAWKNF